jgi:hypothetical protein
MDAMYRRCRKVAHDEHQRVVVRYFFVAIGKDQRGRNSLDTSPKKLENIERSSVGPVDIFDYHDSWRRPVGDCFKNCIEDLAALTSGDSLLQRATYLHGYVVKRTKRARGRQVVARTP